MSKLNFRTSSVLALAGLLLASLALAACGGGGSSSTEASTTEGAAEESSASAEPNENGGSTIILGAMAPLTGPVSSLAPVVEGMKAYFETQVNDNGGIGGHKIKFIVKNDEYDPSKAPAQARALVEEDEIQMMCGNVGTPPLTAIGEYLTSSGVPDLALSGDAQFAGPETTIFQQLTPYAPLGAQVAEFAVNGLGKKSVAIAYSPDGVGEPFKEGAEAELSKLGIKPAAVVEFNPEAPDQSTVAAKLKASGAEVVMVNHVAPIVTLITKAAKQIGYEPTWASTFALNEEHLSELAEGTLDGAYLSTPYLIGTEPEAAPYREGIKAYSAKLNPEAPILMEGWTTAAVCAEVLEQAVEAAGGEAPSREQILETMKQFKSTGPWAKGLEWTAEDHTGQKDAQIIQFNGKTFKQVKPFSPVPEVSTAG